MSARHAYYFLLFAACFLTGAGHYIAGPVLMVLAMVYRERIVAWDERRTPTAKGEEDGLEYQ